jgi:hypothetical protein
MPRPDRPELSKQTRQALFVLGAAADAGFELRAPGVGKLETVGPPGLPDDLCQPVLDAIRVHGGEILRLLKWFDAEADQGRIWCPAAEPRTRQ